MSEATRDGTERPGTWAGELEAHYWAMEPRRLATLSQLAAEGRLEAQLTASPEALEAARQRGRPKAISGGVVTVPLKGVLAPVGGLLALLFDIPNPLDVFQTAMREAIADPDVGAIVIEVDSPGGVVDGIPEAAAALKSMRGSKPIVASANTMAASAAYWLASQADEVVVTPSGAVGSIGVYAMHRDVSGAMELLGIKNTLISAGKFKVDGNPYEPLSDTARAAIQEDTDYFYGLFTSAVARGRGAKVTDVKSGYGEGRVLNAKAALDANLVDRVETLGETVARLSSRSRGTVRTAAEADGPERELEAAEADAGAGEGAEGDDAVYSAEEKASYRDLVADLQLERVHDSVVGA